MPIEVRFLLWWAVGLTHGLILRDQILALFKKLFRRSKPDGVRAPDPTPPRGLSIDGEWLILRMPLPSEEALLEMLYQHREHGRPMGMILDISFDGDFCDGMLSAQRAGTPGQHETKTTR